MAFDTDALWAKLDAPARMRHSAMVFYLGLSYHIVNWGSPPLQLARTMKGTQRAHNVGALRLAESLVPLTRFLVHRFFLRNVFD